MYIFFFIRYNWCKIMYYYTILQFHSLSVPISSLLFYLYWKYVSYLLWDQFSIWSLKCNVAWSLTIKQHNHVILLPEEHCRFSLRGTCRKPFIVMEMSIHTRALPQIEASYCACHDVLMSLHLWHIYITSYDSRVTGVFVF